MVVMLFYGAECSSVKNLHIQKMKVARMRVLRWMFLHLRPRPFLAKEPDCLLFLVHAPFECFATCTSNGTKGLGRPVANGLLIWLVARLFYGIPQFQTW